MIHERLYGLDWLRIGAFGLLIFYHIGMYFVPWDWHVKTPEPLAWAQIPMLAVNAWRLSLLFLVSGVASVFLLDKLGGGSAFVRSRSLRLLLPLATGMVLVVPPQPWIELTTQHDYGEGFWRFWWNDYFRFETFEGIVLPTWNHLWFVVYLWVYTMILAAATMLPTALAAALRLAVERLLSGSRLLLVPAFVLFVLRMTLYPRFGETHALLDDWYQHAEFGFMFGLGVLLARSQTLWVEVVRLRHRALVLATAGFAIFLAYRLYWPETGSDAPGYLEAAARVARACQAWAAIVALLGYSRVHLHHDNAARRYLTEAIFPFYIAHQTIIVVAAYLLRPLTLGAFAEFMALVAITLTGCLAFFEAARRSGPLRPFLGLSPPQRQSFMVSIRKSLVFR
jgi:hypothetical protein